jgi:hypothetical protein
MQCRGILGAQDGIEDGFFLRNIKAFLDGISTPKKFSKAQPTTQVYTPRV